MDFSFFKKEEKSKEEEVIEREVCDKVYDFFVEFMKKLGFEDRLGQQDMALDISEAIRDNQHILVEAGVGIGKSFAYLVPLLFYNRTFETPIAISTSTISLQEQLMGDIKDVSKMMGYEPKVTLAKGMTHYICRKRAESYINRLYLDDIEKWKKYSWIKKWMVNKGDRAELPEKVQEEFWNEINVNNCFYGKCEYYHNCFFMKNRDKMATTSGVILCNHDLLVVDAQKKNNKERALLSSNIKFIVIDEAHNLEEKVRNSLQTSWNYSRTIGTIKDALYFLKRCGNAVEKETEEEIYSLIKKIYIQLSQNTAKEISKSQVTVSEISRFNIELENVKEDIKQLCKNMNDINSKVNLVDNNILLNNQTLEEFQDEVIEELKGGENFFLKLAYEDIHTLNWIELSSMKNRFTDVNIFECPKEMDKTINNLLFYNENEHKHSMRKLPKVILTSATLTNNFKGDNEHRYEYIIKNIGFPVEEDSFISDPKESPYEYDENTLIYYKDKMPHPMNHRKEFLDKCVVEIKNLLNITEGKSLILFTAKDDMNYVYRKLQDLNLPYNILKQMQGSSQEQVMNNFKNDTNSVLLGSGTYWEGINIPGVSLSSVIIVRLPFPVPDPIIEYKRKISKNPLMEVNVPEMVIKMRQGVGRLIRKNNDTGIITILDPRVGDDYNTEYKDIIWQSLPMKRKTKDLKEVKRFVQNKILTKEAIKVSENKEKKITYREYISSKNFGKDTHYLFEIIKNNIDEVFYKITKEINKINESNDNREVRKILIDKLYEVVDILRSPVDIRTIDIQCNSNNIKNTGEIIDGILRKIKVWKIQKKFFKDEKNITDLIIQIKKVKSKLKDSTPKNVALLNMLNMSSSDSIIIVVKNNIIKDSLKSYIENIKTHKVISVLSGHELNDKKFEEQNMIILTFMPNKQELDKVRGLNTKILIYEHERED